jgi:hypothetical protein
MKKKGTRRLTYLRPTHLKPITWEALLMINLVIKNIGRAGCPSNVG